jgi:hypothetical protein
MKNYAVVIILLISILSSHHTMAQRQACIMPDNGYWQLVTHESDPRLVLVKFYDPGGHLIYQERMTVAPDWHRKKICRVLNQGLEAALTAYREHRRLPEDSGFVAGLLGWPHEWMH